MTIDDVYKQSMKKYDVHPSIFEKIKLGHVERLSSVIVALRRNTIGNLKIIGLSKSACSILPELMIHIIVER
jgi:hypothetical protein